MDWDRDLWGLLAGLLISIVTAPVGISGAVFLLPVQLDLLRVPNPQVTATNLLFNVVSVPGALTRFTRQGQLAGSLTRLLVVGTLPGVVVGSVIRVYLVPGQHVFRLLMAALLLAIGIFVLTRRHPPADEARRRRIGLGDGRIRALALGVGVVGGIYGIGGGSILGPILVGSGFPVAKVAPAALASTFLASLVGACAYAVISLSASGDIAPDWSLGVACGVGGLAGGYIGALFQPRLPERALRYLLGTVAIALAVTYVVQAIS